MATSHEVNELRKAGKIDDAYAMALELAEVDPTDLWNIRAIGWAIYSKAKAAIASEDYGTAKACLAKLDNIQIDNTEGMLLENLQRIKLKAQPERKVIEDAKAASKAGNNNEALTLYRQAVTHFPKEQALQTSLAWELQKMGKEIFRAEKPDILTARKLLAEYMPLSTERPSRLHSSFLRFADKIKDDAAFGFIQFIKLWDLANLTEEDYQPYVIEGTTYTGLAEKVIQHAGKIILEQKVTEADWYLPHLSKAITAFPENIWLTYYKARILRMLNRSQEAITFLLPVIKAKSGEYWTWSLMGDLQMESDKALAHSCYCKSLQCKSEEKFLSNVRQKLAELLMADGSFNEAKTEIEAIIKAKAQEGLSIPAKVSQWQSAIWYSSAVTAHDNQKYYSQHTTLAEELSFSELPWLDACLGPTFQIPDKPGKFKRKIYHSAGGTIQEVTVSAGRFPSVRHQPAGRCVSIKGEQILGGPFQVYLLRLRQNASGPYDIFQWINANIIQIIPSIEGKKPALRIAAIIEAKEFEAIVAQEEFSGEKAFSEGQPVQIKAIIRLVSDGSKRLQILQTGKRPDGRNWDVYQEVVGVIDYISPDHNKAHIIINRTVEGLITSHSFNLTDFALGQNVAVTTKKIRRSDGNTYHKILTCQPTHLQPSSSIAKDYHGNIEISANGFGFINDIFVDASLIQENHIVSGKTIRGKAVISYNKKKERWGWKAIFCEVADFLK